MQNRNKKNPNKRKYLTIYLNQHDWEIIKRMATEAKISNNKMLQKFWDENCAPLVDDLNKAIIKKYGMNIINDK